MPDIFYPFYSTMFKIFYSTMFKIFFAKILKIFFFAHVKIILRTLLLVIRISLDFVIKSVFCCFPKVLDMCTCQFILQALLILPVLNLHVGDLLGILRYFPVELDIDEPRTCLQRCLHID